MIIAGTGHRPQFCPCGFDKSHKWLEQLRGRIRHVLKSQSWECVNSGGAIGFDTWLAQEALNLDIPVEIYSPFKGQGTKWPKATREEYSRILECARKVYYTSDEYYQQVFFDRDADLIKNADTVVSLLNPEAKKGGTFHTVNLAKKANKKIINVWTD